jgi:hypothetical protein
VKIRPTLCYLNFVEQRRSWEVCSSPDYQEIYRPLFIYLFICSLFNDAFPVIQAKSVEWRVISGWWIGTDFRRKRSWRNTRFYPGIFFEGLRKTTENIVQNSRSPSRRLSPGPPEYEAMALDLLNPKFVYRVQKSRPTDPASVLSPLNHSKPSHILLVLILIVTMRVFWDIAPCGLVRRFRCYYCLHYQIESGRPCFCLCIAEGRTGTVFLIWGALNLRS